MSLVGATPRLVDVDPSTHLMTAERVEAAIGPRTRCVIPVHLMGATVDMDPILALARERRPARSSRTRPGARRRATAAGASARSATSAASRSIRPRTSAAWGDGGAVVTNDPSLAERVRLLRSHGERPRYHHRMVGTTARLDALQAAILRVKLRRLEELERRPSPPRARCCARGSTARASSCPAPASARRRPRVPPVHRAYAAAATALRAHLDERGVSTAVHYPFPIHRTEAYADLGLGEGSLPVAERLAEQICTLPLFPSMSDDEVAQVIEAVRDFDTEAS